MTHFRINHLRNNLRKLTRGGGHSSQKMKTTVGDQKLLRASPRFAEASPRFAGAGPRNLANRNVNAPKNFRFAKGACPRFAGVSPRFAGAGHRSPGFARSPVLVPGPRFVKQVSPQVSFGLVTPSSVWEANVSAQ